MAKEETFTQVNKIGLNELIRYLNNVLRMGRILQGMLYKFRDAYLERMIDLSKEIIEQDDRLDLMEVELSYEGMRLLTSFSFTGIYLKACFMSLNLVHIFENMGDLFEKNAKLNIEIMNNPHLINSANFEDAINVTIDNFSNALLMLSDFINIEEKKLRTKEVLDTFFKKSREVCVFDGEVDSLIKAYKSYLYKSKDSVKVISLHIEILNNILTFSDLTTNISENIIWALTGDFYKCRNNELELFYCLGEE
ncbi:MAG TPA: PhoU domain-containing protein [Defluviitoga sp.]|nr:PhoU domain-containing protein [Defluviitoga sp.]HOP24474.1 PhoU domain-containing protein [Defluviitoga sp.]HPZ28689.1 PhoU domain-containing protein [Defluviitoga sp.]HQD62691.1 PhoU domain-containing protein [Defluviitoga sp.]